MADTTTLVQRSMDWRRARLGKLTSSEISVLIKDRKEPMTDEELAAHKAANPKSRTTTKVVPFSDATFSYLNRKVMEHFMPLDSKDWFSQNCIDEYIEMHSQESASTRYGSDMESVAREKYAEVMGYEVFETGFTPYSKYPRLVGGSPDGILRQENGIIEIKCPFTLEKHLQHLSYESQDDLRENEPEYFWQCVGNMLFTDADFCDFVSYCPYVSKSKQLKVLRVYRNEADIALLSERISLAVEYMKDKISTLNDVQAIIT